jgi:hypothetical protein
MNEQPKRLELGPAAFHGLLGKTVRMIEPVTEAAAVGVLVSYATAFGAAVGPIPFVLADGARHTARLFAVLVGKTARARKGTSWRVTRNVIALADAEFAARRIFGGFGSGEALIEAVGEEVGEDDDQSSTAEPRDVRALILEEEFARILRVAERDGSTLSPVIRQAWDDGDLSVLTRKRPVRARGAHIAVLAHVTEDELLARLRGVELANGFGNRFIFIRVERSKRIPDGRGLDRDEVERLGYEWRKTLERARTCAGPIKRSREADALWRDWYLSLDDDRPGMLGALLARAEAQVLRLSLVYALADGEATIDVPHLYAALDVWRYAEQSALAIFGDAVGNPVADLILRELRDRRAKGMTRTEIREAIGHHERATSIEAALDLLADRSLARCERVPTGGRATERWYAIFPPEGREERGGNETSLPYLPLLRSEVGQQEAARAAGAAEPRGDEGNVSSQVSRGSSNNRHIVPEEDPRGDLHEGPARDAGASEAELRRWAGGGEAP